MEDLQGIKDKFHSPEMTTDNFDNVNHLVLNFYADGYTLAVKLNEFPVFTSETILETAKISYEDTSLLDYIENEELPPLLVDMIDSSPKLSQYKIWHNGCLILEIRDKTSNNSYFILLKPTNLSMLNDVLNLTESNLWSTMDRLRLESQIVLHNSPHLFLEPDASQQPPEEGSPAKGADVKLNLNGTCRTKPKLPYNKLKSIYSKKLSSFKNPTTAITNNNRHNNSTSRLSNNISGSSNSCSNNQKISIECLPPELVLQQFLATQRAKKKPFNVANLAKFHRFKKHSNGMMK